MRKAWQSSGRAAGDGAAAFPEVWEHRSEVGEAAEALAGGDPGFRAVSYAELFSEWEGIARAGHLEQLRRRYAVAIG